MVGAKLQNIILPDQTMHDLQALQQIFSDADLIDVDFSHWDSSIALWVVADHFGREDDNSLPVVVIHFEGVEKFYWNFGFQPRPDIHGQGHLQWNIYKCDIEELGVGIKITLGGSVHMPSLEIHFHSTRVERASKADIEAINPHWKKGDTGLVRPGISALASMRRKK